MSDNNNRMGWLTRTIYSIKAFFRKIKLLFSSNTNRPAATVSPTDNSNLDHDTSYDQYLQAISRLDDVVVKMGLHERINASQKYMYEMGRRDGSLGVRLKNLADLALAHAREAFKHIYVILNGKLSALQAELKAAVKERDNDETLYNREQAYYDYVKFQYRFFPRSYSLLLFFIYFTVAAALIIADMPLALRLIQDGFNLEGGIGENTFPYLFVGKFWYILAINWETAVTAIGLALCTIYIKIYYDEFVGTPFANRYMTYKKFLEENNITAAEEAETNITGEQKRKKTWKTVLFIVTLGAIVFLAFFRLQTVTALNPKIKFNFIGGGAFLALAILFPLIGGICLSYAFNNLQNILRFRKARRQCTKSRNKWLMAVASCTAVEKNYSDLLAASNRLGDEERIVAEYKDYLIAYYERGYAIGGMQPEKFINGEDFYTKILEWRNMAVSRKINNHITNLN